LHPRSKLSSLWRSLASPSTLQISIGWSFYSGPEPITVIVGLFLVPGLPALNLFGVSDPLLGHIQEHLALVTGWKALGYLLAFGCVFAANLRTRHRLFLLKGDRAAL